jgi:long-chain fatty acid transport protein
MEWMTATNRKLVTAVSAFAFFAAAGAANASGFQIREQSTKALSNSMAGAAAGGDDVSYMAYNPAAIGLLDGTRVAGSFTYIDPSFEFKDAEASTALGTPISGPTDNGGKGAYVPAAAAKWRINDQVDVGVGFFGFYGLETEYDKDWIGRYHGVQSELKTFAITPTVSFKPTSKLTLAGGVMAQYADATLSSAIDFGTIGAANGVPGANPGNNDGFVKVSGDDWGYGFTLGAIYEFSKRTRMGIAYHSKVDHTLTGDANFTEDDAGIANALQTASGAFTDSSGKADLSTPASIGIGFNHQATDRLTLLANVEWTQWSEFDKLVVKFGDNTPDSVTVENWDDTWMVSVGGNYQLNDRWTLRGGAGYDQTPVPDAEHRTPRIPDEDRTWLSLGTTFSPSDRLSISGAWVHLFIKNSDVNQRAGDEGNSSRGNLSGKYEGYANIYSIQADYRF